MKKEVALFISGIGLAGVLVGVTGGLIANESADSSRDKDTTTDLLPENCVELTLQDWQGFIIKVPVPEAAALATIQEFSQEGYSYVGREACEHGSRVMPQSQPVQPAPTGPQAAEQHIPQQQSTQPIPLEGHNQGEMSQDAVRQILDAKQVGERFYVTDRWGNHHYVEKAGNDLYRKINPGTGETTHSIVPARNIVAVN